MFTSALEFFRVLVIFSLVFGVLPYFAARKGAEERLQGIVSSLVRAVLFAQVAGIVLGSAQICLTGSMAAAYLLFLASTLLLSGHAGTAMRYSFWAGWFHGLLTFLEQKRWQPDLGNLAELEWRRLRHVGLVLLLICVAIGAIWYPISNDRFQEIGSYSRALSLSILTSGQSWQVDGSTAFLAPVVFFSGLPAVTVIRHSNVLLALLLAIAAGYFVFRRTGRAGSAALAIAAAALAVQAGRGAPELAAAEIALIFWFFGLGNTKRPLWNLYFAIALALLISLTPDRRSLMIAGIVVAIALLSTLLERLYLLFPRGAVPILLGLVAVAQPITMPAVDGPFQYEAAARAVRYIADQFPRNRWLVVSPVHETPFLYGRGWHLELVEFTETYTAEQVAAPDFQFSYEPEDVFIFVEKVPLAAGISSAAALQMLEELDVSILAYNTAQARQSLEFTAGRLMAAYRKSHPETKTFYEDHSLIVYHVRSPEPRAAGAPGALE
jgi:hypothetical protein